MTRTDVGKLFIAGIIPGFIVVTLFIGYILWVSFRHPERVGEVLQVMRSLAEEGMTMIVVTHEIRFARDVADRVVFMDQGAIVESNAPDLFFDAPSNERTKNFLSQIVH